MNMFRDSSELTETYDLYRAGKLSPAATLKKLEGMFPGRGREFLAVWDTSLIEEAMKNRPGVSN